MSEYNDLIKSVHRLADEFGAATEPKHQEQVLQEFIEVAEKVVVHNNCPASYRTYLEKKIPEFKLLLEGLKAASEVIEVVEEELDEVEGEPDGLYIPEESAAVMDEINGYKKVMGFLQEQRYGCC